MSFQGEIASLPLSDVVQNLATNRRSGTLAVRADGVNRYIQFREGAIVSYTDTAGFSIARWLADKEVLLSEQLQEGLRRRRRAKRKGLGEILRDLGHLEFEDYTSYYRELVKETLCEVLCFRKGAFKFQEGVLDQRYADREASSVGLCLNAQNVLMEAARQMDDWERIRRHIPSEDEVYVIDPAERERLLAEETSDLLQDTIQLLDGSRTLHQVLAKLPYSRFDACCAAASLIAEKRARPVDGAQLIEQATGIDDPDRAIAHLKTVLEREPNNRDVLSTLARLHGREGHKEESATCHKLLAASHLEDNDLERAEKHLRHAIQLNPRDIGAWRKLWELIKRNGDTRRVLDVGRDIAGHFRKLGLNELAREHLIELSALFPSEEDVRLTLADTCFALGDQKNCVEVLMDLAREYVRQERWDDAQRAYARLLKYDRSNRRARDAHDKLRSGMIQRRRERRRRLARRAVLVIVALSLGLVVVYDYRVRSELFQATRSVFAESLIEDKRYEEALSRIESVREKHPLSWTSIVEARALADSLRKKAEHESAEAGPVEPAVPDRPAPAPRASRAPSLRSLRRTEVKP